MKFDRNTILGLVILGALFFGYFYYTNQEQMALNKARAREQFVKDSIARVNGPKKDTLAIRRDSLTSDSATRAINAGTFQQSAGGTEQLVTLENDLIRVTFTTKGGQPKMVELKKYKGPDSSLVKLAGSNFNKLSYTINTAANRSAQTGDLFFSKIDSVTNADKSKTISFTLQSSDSASAGTAITHSYTIKPDDYMIGLDVKMNGADKLLTQGIMNLNWQYAAAQQESDVSFEKQNTQIGYVEDGEFDYHTIGRRSSKTFDKNVKWVGVRQRFFFSLIVAKDNFASGKMDWTVPADSMKTIVESTTNLRVQFPVASSATQSFSLYYGPSDYHLLRKYDLQLDKLVNLGQGMYAFVRPLNRFVILPIFDFMKSIGGSYGIAILLLTLFIRLLISPLTYSSYLSGAKMKALRPEIATLKAKFGEDQQAMSMEQMKLFREAGVNPLGGCIPALLQIPIFFALYSFFNSQIGLRGASFLWANDLSAFDEVIKWGDVPVLSFLLGHHLSMFTITAVITSFLISLYSMSMTPDQNNPMLKYMPYIFPVFMLFIFNRLPSALTWYYTVSNLITLALQFVIQNYIIDHDKILVQIAENRKKPKAKSKWAERMEQMQEQQKRMKDAQQKNKK